MISDFFARGHEKEPRPGRGSRMEGNDADYLTSVILRVRSVSPPSSSRAM